MLLSFSPYVLCNDVSSRLVLLRVNELVQRLACCRPSFIRCFCSILFRSLPPPSLGYSHGLVTLVHNHNLISCNLGPPLARHHLIFRPFSQCKLQSLEFFLSLLRYSSHTRRAEGILFDRNILYLSILPLQSGPTKSVSSQNT